MNSRSGVFISYSDADRDWLAQLHVHLRFLEREHQFSIWDDSRITWGANRKEAIREAIRSARVAVLLISPNYLASDFINDEELPPLLAAAAEDGAVILPIIVSHCMYQETSALALCQPVNSPARPLIEMQPGERDALYVRVTREIRSLLEANRRIKKQNGGLREVLSLSLARVSLLLLLGKRVEEQQGVTLKDVWQKSGIKSRRSIVTAVREMEENGLLIKYKGEKYTCWKLSAIGREIVREMSDSLVFKAQP